VAEQKPPAVPAKRVQPEAVEAWDHPRVVELKEKFAESVLSAVIYAGELTCTVDAGQLTDLCSHLKTSGFTYLVDLIGIHYPEAERPFTVAYLLHNMNTQDRIRLKVEVSESEAVPTVTGIWKTAGWLEREAYDLLGIQFDGHPDLRRILTWEGFNGHPLRKDFPLRGIDTGAAVYEDRYPDGGGPVMKEAPAPPAAKSPAKEGD